MEIAQFNKTGFRSGMKATHKAPYNSGKTFLVVSVDFEEALLCLREREDVEDEDTWARCENCEIIEP